MSKFWLSFLVAIFSLTSVFSVNADIEGTHNDAEFITELMADNGNDELEHYLIDQCMSLTDCIDVTKFKVPADEAYGIFMYIFFVNPQLLVKNCNYTVANDFAQKLYITYMYRGTMLEDARNVITTGMNEYIEVANKYKKPLEKALALHDELVKRCNPDDNMEEISYHAYGLFKNQKAVCQGYSQAYASLLHAVGIDVDMCSSEYYDHMWNYVKIDDKWYHVDVTYDDHGTCREPNTSIAYHEYFMLSNETMNKKRYDVKKDWIVYSGRNIVCDSKKYESGHMFNLKIPCNIQSVDGKLRLSYNEYVGLANFTYPDLYVGKMMVSDVIYGRSKNYAIYEVLCEIENAPSIIVATYKNNGETETKLLVHKADFLKNGIIVELPEPIDDGKIKYMMWDFDSLKPLGKSFYVE